MDILLKHVRLSFPDHVEPREYKPGDGKPRYNATLLIERGSENEKLILAAIDAEAKETWKDKAGKALASFRGNGNKFCYLDGNNKDYDGYEGMWYLACHSPNKPALFDNQIDPQTKKARVITDKDEAKRRIYAGCYVNAKVSIWAQTGENSGIRASFSGLQFAQDGDAFSGARAASADDFSDCPLTDGADAAGFI